MKKTLTLVLLIIGTCLTYAQTNWDSPTLTSSVSSGFSNFTNNENLYSLEEKRFLKDSTFRKGELKTRNGHEVTTLKYRFDQVNRSVETLTTHGQVTSFPNEEIVYFKLFFGSDSILFAPLALSEAQETRLYQVVYKTPTLELYRDLSKKVNVTYSSGKYNYEPENDYHYYLRKTDKERFKEVDITAKSLITALPEKRNQITHFFKGKKKTDITMSKLMRFMAELDKHATLQ